MPLPVLEPGTIRLAGGCSILCATGAIVIFIATAPTVCQSVARSRPGGPLVMALVGGDFYDQQELKILLISSPP
jgi:hypothetical protein